MVRTQIQLTDSQARELRNVAAQQGISVAALIRRFVDRMLPLQSIRNSDEMRARAIAAAGRIHSGTGDLASRHDEYAAEAFQQ